MAKNYSIDVGDADAINEAINKQKVYIVATFYSFHLKWWIISSFLFYFEIQNVVRVLESRKPQLDELIIIAEVLKTDNNRPKLQSKGKNINL